MKKLTGLILVLIVFSAQAQVVIKTVTAESSALKPTPLYIIDGIKIGRQDQVPNIDPNDIEKVEVLKDESTTALYGTDAQDGVILITTKNGKFKKTYSEKALSSENAPLYILDGVKLINEGESVSKTISKVDPNNIKSVEVLKGESALIYGDEGKNGVVIITTKKGKIKKSE